MRSCKGPAGEAVALPRLRQQAHIIVLDLDRRALHEGALERAFERQHGEREGPWPARLTRRLDQRREPRDRIEPCRRDGHAGFRHLLLKPGIERRRSLAHLKQAVPLAPESPKPVPISTTPSSDITVAATAQPPGPSLRASSS